MTKDSTKIDDSEALIQELTRYPMLEKTLKPYVKWAITKTPNNGDGHKVIKALRARNRDVLSKLEKLFFKSQAILDISMDEFIRTFGFHNDLLEDNPEKIHDVIAEPLLVVKLTEHGFSSIKKLPRSIVADGTQLALADFTAERSSLKFAIELKTTRTEHEIVKGKPIENAMQPDWWGEMFLNNARTKIENKDRHLIKQLRNTCDHFGCQFSMLVLYSRRMGVSALSDPHEYRERLEILQQEYVQIDFFASLDYFGTFAMVPDLP